MYLVSRAAQRDNAIANEINRGIHLAKLNITAWGLYKAPIISLWFSEHWMVAAANSVGVWSWISLPSIVSIANESLYATCESVPTVSVRSRVRFPGRPNFSPSC